MQFRTCFTELGLWGFNELVRYRVILWGTASRKRGLVRACEAHLSPSHRAMADFPIYNNLYPPNMQGVPAYGSDLEEYQMEHCLMSMETALNLVVEWNKELQYLRKVYPTLHGLSNFPATDPKLVLWRHQRDVIVPAYLARLAQYIESIPQ